MEPAIRQWYSDVTGRDVRLPEKILMHSVYPFMLASLDGYTDDRRVVEIKTARSGKGWGKPGTNEIPDFYALQAQHYLIVTGFEVCDVPVSISGSSPELYEVPADKELQEAIIEAAVIFWKRVQDGNPPDPITYADAVARYGKSIVGGPVFATQDAIEAVNSLRFIRDRKRILEADEEDLKGRIISALGDAGDALVDDDGNTLVTYRIGKGRQTFDAKAFGKDHPDLYEKYLRNGEPSRRFLLK
jgi:predicted phage-related endonuclease